MIHYMNIMDLVDRIEPDALSSYLECTGWRRFPRDNPSVRNFQLENNIGFFQADIPMKRNLSDYKDTMFRAIRIVAKAERKSVGETVAQLLNLEAEEAMESIGINKGDILFISSPM